MRQLCRYFAFWIVGAVVAIIAPAAQAQEKTSPGSSISAIPWIGEVEQPLTEAKWLTQASPLPEAVQEQVAQITAVQLKPTDQGLEVILETAGAIDEVLTSSAENSLITDIPNAQLRLPEVREFRQNNPTKAIASVIVSNLDAKTIRVTVTGKAGVPTAEVSQSPQALILSVTAPPAPAPVAPPATPAEPTPAPAAPPPATPAPTTPPGEPQPKPQTQEEKPVEFEVTAEEEEGRYNVPDATTATRTDAPIRDIPASIQVIPQQVIEDQQVIRLEEALRNVSGVTFGGAGEGAGLFIGLRGFDGVPVLLDGFRQYGLVGLQSTLETANLERIEVLKGPASILYGEIQPGGVINLVSKKPLSEPFYEAELQVGSRGFVRPRIDLSGPLTSDGNLLYRLNALYERGDSFRDFDTDIERVFFAPVVTWKIGDRTDLTLQLDYLDNKQPFDTGRVASGDQVLDIPRNRITGEPGDYVENKILNLGYNFEHRFNDNWTLRNAFRYLSRDVLEEFAFPFAFDAATGIITRNYGGFDIDVESYSFQTNIVGKLATGSVQHTLLFGVDLNRTTDDTFATFDFDNPLPLDIFNPTYGEVPRLNFRDLSVFVDRRVQESRLGIYLQDQVTLLDNLKLLAGFRYDTVKQKAQNGATLFDPVGFEATQTDDALTPRVGIVYQPIQPLSLYASYSQSFNPSTESTFSGNILEPERGAGWEAGVKAELPGGIFATLAYFDITKQNVATEDPNNPFLSIATGEQRSRGVELDVIGQILPGWNVIASYAYIDAKVTQDNTFPIGNRLNGIPKNSASLWTTYEIQQGDLQGLGAGIGFNYVGNRQGDLENSFELGSYFLTNAAIFYRRNNWRTAINFKNIFNVDYSNSPFGNTRIDVGEPFTVIGSVSVEF